MELGGWDYLNVWGNPPSALLEDEVSKVSLFLVHHALLTPELHVHSRADAVAVGDGTWRVPARHQVRRREGQPPRLAPAGRDAARKRSKARISASWPARRVAISLRALALMVLCAHECRKLMVRRQDAKKTDETHGEAELACARAFKEFSSVPYVPAGTVSLAFSAAGSAGEEKADVRNDQQTRACL